MSEATLTLFIQFFFWGLALFALMALARFRNRVRLDIALVMLATALALTSPNWYGDAAELGQLLSTTAVVAHPFLLLQLVKHFRQVRPYISRLAFGGMVISGGILLLPGATELPTIFVLAYFISIEGFAVVAFFQGARVNSGVSHWRLSLVALGILTLLLGIVTFVFFRQLFVTNTIFGLIPILLTMIAGAAFYLGFAPPRSLRKYWQLRELNQFLHNVPAQYADMALDRVVQYLCLAAHRSVDSITAVAALLDQENDLLTISTAADMPELANFSIPAGENRLGRVWLGRGPYFAATPGDLGQIGLELTRALGAQGILTVPIATPAHTYGLLLVFCRQTPLFVDDDLDLLSLLTMQTARTLSYSHLLVSERTARNQAEMLAHIAARLSANIELEQTVAVVCEETLRVVDCSFTAVFTPDPSQPQTYHFWYGAGQMEAIKPLNALLPPAQQADIAAKPHPILLEIAQADAAWPGTAQLMANNIHSVAYAPLAHKDQLIGVLAIGAIGEAEAIASQDLPLLQAIADQAALAIQNGRLYRKIQQYNDELEDRVAQRTADLQARNEELDAFAHTVAHDLKMPISHMVGLAETVANKFEDLPPTDRKRYLEIIQQSGHKMASIIDALLLLAGVREMDVPIAPLDMMLIIEEARQRLAHLNRQYGVAVILPDEWPQALGYAPWVEEIWVNYLSNGMKYGGHPPQLTLGARPEGEMIRFWIRDNGIGITPEMREQLFVPFTQLNLRHDSGYGLGLSIVQRIVERLGGEVGAESIPGEGGLFWFTLPAAPETITRSRTLIA